MPLFDDDIFPVIEVVLSYCIVTLYSLLSAFKVSHDQVKLGGNPNLLVNCSSNFIFVFAPGKFSFASALLIESNIAAGVFILIISLLLQIFSAPLPLSQNIYVASEICVFDPTVVVFNIFFNTVSFSS